MEDGIIQLRDTSIVTEHGGRAVRFRVHSASVSITDSKRRPIHIRFDGPQCSHAIRGKDKDAARRWDKIMSPAGESHEAPTGLD
jgi:hypothetical protein